MPLGYLWWYNMLTRSLPKWPVGPGTIPSNWISVKDEWIKYIGLYGLSGTVGLVLFLVTYYVPAKENTSIKPFHPFFNVLKNVLLLL